jgi:hypothetical protein
VKGWLKAGLIVLFVVLAFFLPTLLLSACQAPGEEQASAPEWERIGFNMWRCVDWYAGVVCYKADRGLSCIPVAQTALMPEGGSDQ